MSLLFTADGQRTNDCDGRSLHWGLIYEYRLQEQHRVPSMSIVLGINLQLFLSRAGVRTLCTDEKHRESGAAAGSTAQ